MKVFLIGIISCVWLLVGCTGTSQTLPISINQALDSMFEPGYRTFLYIMVDGEKDDEWLQLQFRKVSIEKIQDRKKKPEEFKF